MRNMTYCKALTEAQREELQRDKDVILIGEDVEKFGGGIGQDVGLFDIFGEERVTNMPISESGYCGAAVGMAMLGKRPIVELMFADFCAYAFDSIANQAAKTRFMSGGQWKVPVVYRACQGAGFGAGAQHSQSIEGWFQNVPGLKIVMPSTPADALGLLKTAIRDDDPVLFLEHKGLFGISGEVPEGDYTIPYGKANVAKKGKDVTIIAFQMMFHQSLAAAEQLEKEGIEVEVIDPRTLFPFDMETIIESVTKTGRALIVHESPLRGGIGGEISARIADEGFKYLKAPIKRLGATDNPIPFAKAEFFCLPDVNKIVKAVKELINYK